MKNSSTFLWGAVLFFSGTICQAAVTLPDYCSASNVHTIDVPIEYSHPALTMPHRYQYLNESLREKAPTIIALPGGPAYGWISGQDAASFAVGNGFPKDTPIILVDPRGANCNFDSDGLVPPSTYRTSVLAKDVAQIIRHENLKNYVVYGGSYGTVWGTALYREVVAEKLPLPTRMVFDGTPGKVMPHEMGVEAARIWDTRKWELSRSVRKKLSGKVLPFGFDGSTWAAYIDSLLEVGTIFGPESPQEPVNFLKKRLEQLNGTPADVEDLRKRVARFQTPARVRATSKLPPEPSDYVMAREIGCHELNLDPGYLTLEKGSIKVTSSANDYKMYCEGAELDTPYDANDADIRVPIFYLVGKYDIQTPVWQAAYHIRGQSHAPVRGVFFSLAGAHWGLGRYFNDCANDLWKFVLGTRWENRQRLLPKCRIPYEYRKLDPWNGDDELAGQF